MSYDADLGHQIWVSDLDDHVDLDAIFAEHEVAQQEDVLNEELDEIGDIALFAGRTVSSRTLYLRGITPKKWRWMQHDAETSLGQAEGRNKIEAAFLKAIIACGRRYAVARYARSEHLSFSSALTATFPYGIRALIYQYMAGEVSLADHSNKKFVQQAFQDAISNAELTAYDRVGLLRQRIHRLANAGAGPDGHLCLNKEGMRTTLALCRLYFSAIECSVQSVSELIKLIEKYELALKVTGREHDQAQVITGKYIHKWNVRHQRPLIYFYPYSARNALTRLIRQTADSGSFSGRSVAVNELALVGCGIELMRKTARKRCAKEANVREGQN